jgi:transposase InsO family protein
MGISRSTYYYRPKKNLEKKKRDADIADLIEKICYEHPYYGYRRVTAALRRKKIVVNHKKVLKIMKKMSIQCRKRHKFTVTTNSKHSLKVYPNLVKDLVINKTDQL